MTTTDTPTLDQALALARRLPPRDQAQLIARLAEALVAQPAPAADAGAFTLPVLSGGTWIDDLP